MGRRRRLAVGSTEDVGSAAHKNLSGIHNCCIDNKEAADKIVSGERDTKHGSEKMKTRTCKRCSGSGFRSTPVLHLGIPGLCYGCNGSGVQQWVEAVVITAERQRSIDRHIIELNQIIADCEAGYAQGTIRERQYTQWTTEKKTQLATMARTAEPVTKGEWRPAARQTAGV